jgi:hypothetical protein
MRQQAKMMRRDSKMLRQKSSLIEEGCCSIDDKAAKTSVVLDSNFDEPLEVNRISFLRIENDK